MLYARIATLDGDTVKVFENITAAEIELAYYDDEHFAEEIGAVEYDEFLEENGFF